MNKIDDRISVSMQSVTGMLYFLNAVSKRINDPDFHQRVKACKSKMKKCVRFSYSASSDSEREALAIMTEDLSSTIDKIAFDFVPNERIVAIAKAYSVAAPKDRARMRHAIGM